MKTGNVLKTTLSEWYNTAFNQSAALAYYALFSLAPLLLIAIAVAGLVYGEKAAQGQIQEQMTSLVGPNAAKMMSQAIANSKNLGSNVASIIVGGVLIILGASGVFSQLQQSLNAIFHVQSKPGQGLGNWVRTKLLSFGMVLSIGFLLLVSMMVSALLLVIGKWMQNLLPLTAWFWFVVNIVFSIIVVMILIALIFKVLPYAKIRWKDAFFGAFITAILFEIGKFGISYYLSHSSVASTYGAAGSVVAVLVWVYYSSLIVFLGAQFTEVYSTAAGREPEPTPNAQWAGAPPHSAT